MILLIGTLCVNLSAAQDEKSKGKAGVKPQIQTDQLAASLADPIEELKASVDALDKDIKALQAPMHQGAQSLQESLQRATWFVMIIVVLILVSAIWLWLASKRLDRLATQGELEKAVNAAMGEVQKSVDKLAQAVANVSQGVGNTRDASHNDVNELLQILREARSSLQGALDE
jgi:prefoldin subunit 5